MKKTTEKHHTCSEVCDLFFKKLIINYDGGNNNNNQSIEVRSPFTDILGQSVC